MKALDAGAYGVIVPMVNNRAEAEQAVAACRYPPAGIRSFGRCARRCAAGRDDYARRANEEVACIAMIETAEGVDNVDEIAATPGLDGIYIGPSDLALAIGLAPRGDNDDSGPCQDRALDSRSLPQAGRGHRHPSLQPRVRPALP